MALASEILGVVVLAIVIHRSVGTAGLPIVASGAVLIAAVSGLSFWSGLWPEIRGLVQSHDADAKLTLEQSNTEGGALFGVNEGFMAFADHTIPRQARVFIECGQHEATCGSEQDWFGFRMTPRVLVTTPSKAQWAIFYNADAAREPFARGWRILPFASGFALAEAPQ